jgi:hypothetical protein
MAKRANGSKRSNTAGTATPDGTAATSDALEQRVVAFAEQLGRIAGTVQAKTEGWMDRDALNRQIASVRDGASDLLEQLKATVTSVTPGVNAESQGRQAAAATTATGSSGAGARSRGRSGGIVDAPGKKHRKPAPKDARALAADAKASTMRSGKASMKTTKRRGRG